MRGRLLPAPQLLGAAGLVLFSGVLAGTLLRAVGSPGPVAPPAPGLLPASVIELHVEYDPVEVLGSLETSVPVRIGDIAAVRVHPSDPALRYAVQADRGPFLVELASGELRLSTVITYGGQVWYSAPLGLQLNASCGTGEDASGNPIPPPRALVSLVAPLGISPDWNLSGGVRLASVEPVSEADRCAVSLLGLEMDVTDAIMAEAADWLLGLVSEIDDALRSLELAAHLGPWWEMVQDPMELDEEVWFSLNPEALHIGAPRSTGLPGDRATRIEATLEITARPAIVSGPRPMNPRRPLPPPGEPAPEADRRIVLDGLIGYESLVAVALEAVREAPLQWAGRRVELASMKLSSRSPGQLTVEVEVLSPLRGTLRLDGTPVLDPATGSVTMPDLDFAVTKGGILLRIGIGIIRVGFLERIRSGIRIPVEDHLDRARTLAEGGIHATFPGDVRLTGSMHSAEVTHLAPRPSDLMVRARIEATTLLTIGAD